MRAAALTAAAVAALLLTTAAAGAEIFTPLPAGTLTVTCSAGGGAPVQTTGGYFSLSVFTAETTICFASSCATGGMRRAVGSYPVELIPTGPVSCRSTESGTVQLVPMAFVR